MIGSIPSSHATVASYTPPGRQPVGQESADLKNSTFKPLEQSSDTARGQNRRSAGDTSTEHLAQQRQAADSGDVKDAEDKRGRSQGQKEREAKEQKEISELAATDRAVHAHEQAHAAVAGEYAGITTYKFVRGPDGVSYAVGGDVSISTSAVPNDPAATIRKAEQIQRAANAPADPSPQDRHVAAEAARMENEARAQLAAKQAEQVRETRQSAENKSKADKTASDQGEKAEPNNLEEARKKARDEELHNVAKREAEQQQSELARRSAERADLLAKASKFNININRKLVEIGALKGSGGVGNFLNSSV